MGVPPGPGCWSTRVVPMEYFNEWEVHNVIRVDPTPFLRSLTFPVNKILQLSTTMMRVYNRVYQVRWWACDIQGRHCVESVAGVRGLALEGWCGKMLKCGTVKGNCRQLLTRLIWCIIYLTLIFLQGSLSFMIWVDNHTSWPGWYGVWGHLWWLALSQTSLQWQNHSSTAGTFELSPDQGRRGGWWPSTHWKEVRLVEDWVREFWAYSAQTINALHLCVFILQPLYFLIHPLDLAVGLGVVSWCETDMNSLTVAEHLL